jgi:hypothetical protein
LHETWTYNQSLYTITVPLDYDGYSGEGYNYGDGMADAWEKAEFNVPYDTWPIRPFVTVGNRQGPVDYDHVPVGRNIDGDSWCNFAEYRGAIVRTDSTYHSPGSRYQRFDPLRKTVLLHVRNNMDDLYNAMVRDLMPGYVYKLYPDTVQILFTDSIRFQKQKTDVDAARTETLDIRWNLKGRDVNYNRAGAGLWYYAFGAPIRKPMEGDDTIRAVTYWQWREGSEQGPNNWLGMNYHRPVWFSFLDPIHNTAGVPDGTERIVVNIGLYIVIRDSVYGGSTAEWLADFPKECKRTIAHELGHSLGMLELPYDCATVSAPPRLMSPSCIDDSLHRFRIGDSTYSIESKVDFSVKERSR